MVFGGRCLNIREVCMDFEPCFKVHNLVSVYPKGMKLGQMTNLNVIFHVVVSIYQLVAVWNSPQFPVEFRNGLMRMSRIEYSVDQHCCSDYQAVFGIRCNSIRL